MTSGPTIRKYFTGTALTQLNSENVKYLDTTKATQQVKKQLDALTIYKGYILVSDSGTLGRVTYALSQHDGHVATNNLIRVVINNPYLRGYIYEFLKSDLGQSLMLKNAYGQIKSILSLMQLLKYQYQFQRTKQSLKQLEKKL